MNNEVQKFFAETLKEAPNEWVFQKNPQRGPLDTYIAV